MTVNIDGENSAVFWKLILSIGLVVVNVAASFLPIFHMPKFFQNTGISKSRMVLAGLLFSTSIMQLLSESETQPSIDSDGPDIGFPITHFLFGLGFIVFMFSHWTIEGIKHQIQEAKENIVITRDGVGIDTVITNLYEPSHLKNRDDSDSDDDSALDPDKDLKVSKEELSSYQFEGSNWVRFALSLGYKKYISLIFVLMQDNVFSFFAISVETKASSLILLGISVICTDWIESTLYSMAVVTEPSNSGKKSHVYYLVGLYLTVKFSLLAILLPIGPMLGKMPKVFEIASAIKAFISGGFLYSAAVDIVAREIFLYDEKRTTAGGIMFVTIRVALFISAFFLISLLMYISR